MQVGLLFYANDIISTSIPIGVRKEFERYGTVVYSSALCSLNHDLDTLLANLYDGDGARLQVRIDGCCTTLTDSRTSLSAIDAIHIDLRAFIYTLHLDAASFTLNQHGLSSDVSNTVGDALRLGLLVYPAESSRCRFRV